MSERPHVIVCELPPAERYWHPTPFPGGQMAAAEGCTCPADQPWPGKLALSSDCPLHELVRADH